MPNTLYTYILDICFGLVGFYGISTIVGHLMSKSSIHMYIKYIGFSLVGFYGISTIVGYLIPNPLYTYSLNMIWFVRFYGISTIVGYLMPKCSSHIYLYTIFNKYDLVWFYDISTIVGYLMPNPLYTYILNIYDLVWFGFMAYQPL